MASKARQAFDENLKDARRLLQIHADVGGDAQGRRFGLEVLNKSAVVLITAIWEAYCEDLAAEALAHLVENASSASELPKELKKKIAKELKEAQDGLSVWKLADSGWRGHAKARLATLMEERNRKLNTPKATQIDELFENAVGLVDLSTAWRWKKMPSSKAKEKLDEFVTLRGEIAHRGAAATGVKKVHVTRYLKHVESLVAKTEERVNAHVRGSTGKPLW